MCERFKSTHDITGPDDDMTQGDNRYSGYSGEADTRYVPKTQHNPLLIPN